MRFQLTPKNEREDRLFVDGREIGTMLHAVWQLDENEAPYRMGNLASGTTVLGRDTGDLIVNMLAREKEYA